MYVCVPGLQVARGVLGGDAVHETEPLMAGEEAGGRGRGTTHAVWPAGNAQRAAFQLGCYLHPIRHIWVPASVYVPLLHPTSQRQWPVMDRTRVPCLPVHAGEDFAFFCQRVPCTFGFLGIRNESLGSVHALHSPK